MDNQPAVHERHGVRMETSTDREKFSLHLEIPTECDVAQATAYAAGLLRGVASVLEEQAAPYMARRLRERDTDE
ncbi:hypothetical protein V5S96_10175 [Corynebacterium mastitidis]|uniref:Uncharacterized protein n=1 Tax=Corynebacterium mastitidis TaxID=161890 RepID=A0ABU8P348_9CORY